VTARDPEMQKLVDRAARVHARRPDAEAKPAPRPPPSRPAASHRVYFHIHSDSMGMLFWLGVVLGIPGGYFLGIVLERRWVGHVILGLFVARVVVFGVGYLVGWRRFRRFPQGISFPVDGWPGLLSSCRTVEGWLSMCEVVVDCLPGADLELVGAVGDLFVREANRCFYGPGGPIGGAASDPRKPWRRDGLVLSGSGNARVAGEIYRLIRRLDRVARRAGGLRKVTLHCSGSTYDVPRPRVDTGM
jgi:hypothetical protein